ncbi:MAG: DUF4332 domain-containing protein [Candidatus Sericytochromatia bacterium]|nr:DUF4332 domain-containing protein [Candidatus Sericytochromatia bacterium]
MRHSLLSFLALSTLALGACAPSVGQPLAVATSASLRSASLTDEGSLVFDKTVVYRTVEVLGVGATYQSKLDAQGIKTVNQLLLAGTTPSARRRLAEATGISPKLVLRWINHADLMRVTGCGPEYARLLELAGVDTVLELARRNSVSLAARLASANDLGAGKRCVHRLPNVTTTTRWVDNAQRFVRLVTY